MCWSSVRLVFKCASYLDDWLRVTISDEGNHFAFDNMWGMHSVHLVSSGHKVCWCAEGLVLCVRAHACVRGLLYCTTPVVRYESPPLPAVIPLPRLPVPALECFCSILNRLIEQCSRERAACQSQLKTQKQKIKKAHGWTPVLIKKILFDGGKEDREKCFRL